MGAIQQSVNSAISGSAFLLNQAGVFDPIKENREVNQGLKNINAKFERGSSAVSQTLENMAGVSDVADFDEMQGEVDKSRFQDVRNLFNKYPHNETVASRYAELQEQQWKLNMYRKLRESTDAKANGDDIAERIKRGDFNG